MDIFHDWNDHRSPRDRSRAGQPLETGEAFPVQAIACSRGRKGTRNLYSRHDFYLLGVAHEMTKAGFASG